VDQIAQPNPQWSGTQPDPGSSRGPYRIYNIGSNNPVELAKFIETIEHCTGKKAEKNLLPMQPGDVVATYANVDGLINDIGYKPETQLEQGIEQFVQWYRDFYKV
jgi:UDP-glucuronate 4-epimerase